MSLPFGLRDVKLRPIDASDGTVGAGVDLPAARTLSFKDTEESTELRGDDIVQASHGNGAVVEWDLEGGGISLAAYVILAGGTLTTTGTGSTAKTVVKKKSIDARPYFQIEGQSINDDGGDFHTIIYRAKADSSIEGEQADGAFWLTKASGKGYPNEDGDSYDFVDNASVTAIVDPA
jgi:hypothetical protein